MSQGCKVITGGALAFLVLAGVAASSCGELGYRKRELVRSPSPDGQLIAVCKEYPIFDGPGIEVWLERPGGTKLRTVHSVSDGGGCEEIAWSADGTRMAILGGFMIGVMVVDVTAALENPAGPSRAQHLQLGAGSGTERSTWRVGQHLRFVSNDEIAYDSCAWADRDVAYNRQTWQWRCAGPVESRTVRLSEELLGRLQ